MKVLLISLLLCLSVAITLGNFTCDCGKRNDGRIIGGKGVKNNEYPWMVYIGSYCGGALLTRWHVLTTADCVSYRFLFFLRVFVGLNYKSEGNNSNMQEHKAAKIFQYRRYNPFERNHVDDIAVLVTKTPIDFNPYVSAVCLPNKEINLIGQDVKVLGWGRIKKNGVLQKGNQLQEVDIPVISPENCRKHYQSLVEKTQLCTYSPGKDSCQGDGGGPLVYLDQDSGRYTLVALVSFGWGPCAGSIPGVNTNVYPYIDWINDVINQTYPKEKLCKFEKSPESEDKGNMDII